MWALAALLGVVFLVSGVSKIAAPTTWRTQSSALGAPRAAAAALPALEVVVGAMLVAQLRRDVVALLGLLLLVAFTGFLVVRIIQGVRPACACFGSLSSTPIGWGHVARNLGFIALAAVVAVWG